VRGGERRGEEKKRKETEGWMKGEQPGMDGPAVLSLGT
jgi:hypothetical protein